MQQRIKRPQQGPGGAGKPASAAAFEAPRESVEAPAGHARTQSTYLALASSSPRHHWLAAPEAGHNSDIHGSMPVSQHTC